MGHDNERFLPLRAQVLFRPQHCPEIQVVGRLVEEQQGWLHEERAGQGDAHPPAATEFLGGLRLAGLVEPQSPTPQGSWTRVPGRHQSLGG
jgi:hypothetical protein